MIIDLICSQNLKLINNNLIVEMVQWKVNCTTRMEKKCGECFVLKILLK